LALRCICLKPNFIMLSNRWVLTEILRCDALHICSVIGKRIGMLFSLSRVLTPRQGRRGIMVLNGIKYHLLPMFISAGRIWKCEAKW
jgi:hypothetical protein